MAGDMCRTFVLVGSEVDRNYLVLSPNLLQAHQHSCHVCKLKSGGPKTFIPISLSSSLCLGVYVDAE